MQQIRLEAMLLTRRTAQALAPEGTILVLLALPSGIALCTLAICALLIGMTFSRAAVLAAAAWVTYSLVVLGLTFWSNERAIQDQLNLLDEKLKRARLTRARLSEIKQIERAQKRSDRERVIRGRDVAQRAAGLREAKRIAQAPGCQRCGGHDFQQWVRTSSGGTALIVGGLVAALFTCGLGLILVVIGVFLNDRGWRCMGCGYEWRT